MKKNTYLLILMFLFTGLVSHAQVQYVKKVKFENISGVKSNDRLLINMDVLLDGLYLRTNDMLILTPILHSNVNGEQVELPAVVALGKTRNKVYIRNKTLKNKLSVPANSQAIVVRGNKKDSQTISYMTSVPFAVWMQDASLSVRAIVQGCADCGKSREDLLLAGRVVSEPYKPDYLLTYVVPEAEPVKARKDQHSASLKFVVDRHEIVRNYKQNAEELNQVDKVIREVRGNKDINITEFAVTGYASPEANFEYNRELAGRRANSFVDYLISTHGIRREQIKSVLGHGEDWDGLKDALHSSSLPNANAILDIIASTGNPDARDAKIVALDNGATYKILLDRYYPALRRTDYVIAYNVRAFDVEEAKKVIKTNPKHLSLNEMFLVAKTYPEGSREFKEVFDIATRLYPDEPVAIINASAVDIEGGNYNAAVKRLNRVVNTRKDALNNLGVAYAGLGQYDKARECFERAIAAGDKLAKHNLEEFEKVEKQN
ncbi:hypothetical protein HQ47_05145 [Porphyromonas macacae]|uniref:Uncharacterized protein n=1 Tax=Porphyromonas macacae TaxID=28115 RepID=A0A0A2EAE4_9PORP|nr:DUF3868 domain-containing protein [Porphyromonas macacae]KGN74430.1 hypothetical protein HQ47_05145 [Porphyromonas macacae]